MADEAKLNVEEFGATFRGFLEQMAVLAPTKEPVFLRRLREHFGADPSSLPILVEEFERSDHANLQTAIEEFLKGDGRSAELCGVSGDQPYATASLAQLAVTVAAGLMGGSAPTDGPVEYVNIPLDEGRVLACVQNALLFIRDGEGRLCAFVRGATEHFNPKLRLEVMAPDRPGAERFLAGIRSSIRRANVYRGRVISLSMDRWGNSEVHFHRLPPVDRDSIILPTGLLERIERQTVHFSKHKERLLASGRHLRRGVLFHGPPGTGKTYTAMYLAGRMQDRTVLLLTGRSVGMLQSSCAMARLLQPATVVLEDVDLIAEERTHQAGGCNALLFELLNEMDGLADDADVLFLLTTNRPDILEPALASRPGRIDQAIEIPLPDAQCRRRLLDLYGRGLELHMANPEGLVRRTEGVSAAFIRELLRKAAVFAADDGGSGKITVQDKHIEEALHELVVEGGEITRQLLGARRREKTED